MGCGTAPSSGVDDEALGAPRAREGYGWVSLAVGCPGGSVRPSRRSQRDAAPCGQRELDNCAVSRSRKQRSTQGVTPGSTLRVRRCCRERE